MRRFFRLRRASQDTHNRMVASARRPQTKSLIRDQEKQKAMFNRHYVLLPGTDIASTARKLDARAEMLRDMPHRVQLPGSGCGLYSLGMVMVAHPLPT